MSRNISIERAMLNPAGPFSIVVGHMPSLGSQPRNLFHKDPLNLLASIKDENDLACLVRYIKRSIDDPASVKIILLHVIHQNRRDGDAKLLFQAASTAEEDCGATIIKKASQYLRECNIAFDAYIRQGDTVFEILDAAEMFDCNAIVMFKMRLTSWPRLLSHGVIHKVVHSSRGVPVVIVDGDGMTQERRE